MNRRVYREAKSEKERRTTLGGLGGEEGTQMEKKIGTWQKPPESEANKLRKKWKARLHILGPMPKLKPKMRSKPQNGRCTSQPNVTLILAKV